MPTTVEISVDDSGSITVGLTDEPSSDTDQMQPADSVQQALKMAGHLLQQAMANNTPGDSGGAGAGAVPMQPAQDAGASQGSPQANDPSPGGASAQDIWNQLASNGPQH